MKIGFTGTRHGMSFDQRRELMEILVRNDVTEFHHGDRVGSDEEAARLARKYGIKVVGHPPKDNRLRAFFDSDWVRVPKDYLARNRAIVNSTDILIAAPLEDAEQPKGGTWYTVRYARNKGKHTEILKRG